MASTAVRLLSISDLTGGLNLRKDGFDVAPNESPDLLNVVLDSRGGFELREGVTPLNSTATSAVISSMGRYETFAGTKQIVISANGALQYSTGGNFTNVVTIGNTRHSYAQAQDKLYIFAGSGLDTYRWNGSTATAVTTAGYNDTGTPSNAGIPRGHHGAYHMGRLWVAHTIESGVHYPSRLRWSYAANVTNDKGPEDFKTASYIDVDVGGATGKIVALVPYDDKLFVFKTNGVYAITGVDDASFAVQPLSQDFGACGPEAVVATPAGVFFFDYPTGLHAISADGSSVYLFEKLLPILQDGTIQGTAQDKIAVGYHARKVWVSVPYGAGATFNNRTFVLDTAIGGGKRYGLRTPIAEGRSVGAWTQYDFGVGGFMVWAPNGAAEQFIGWDCSTATNRGKRVWKLEGTGVYTDTLISTATHIESHYKTSWLDLKQPAVTKRWKRPTVVMNNDVAGTIIVDVFKDYYAQAAQRQFQLVTTGDVVNDLWDVAQWDVGKWSGPQAQRNSILRGTALGTAKAVQLQFNGPATNAFWGLQSLTLPYVPRQVR